MKSHRPLLISSVIALLITLWLVYIDEGGKGWENFRTWEVAETLYLAVCWGGITGIVLLLRFLGKFIFNQRGGAER